MKSGRPEPNVQHFFEKPVEDTLVGVVIPIYNEQATDLRKTLLSIDMQIGYMRSQRIDITPHIMLVQDGGKYSYFLHFIITDTPKEKKSKRQSK
jgi:hypothetical protein